MSLSPNRNRKWSWAPQEERLLVNPLHRVAVEVDLGEGPVNESLARQTSQLEAAIVASRRLSQVRQVIEARREKRHMRRSLKESGDYLGVQGINPETGQLDIVTPSDSEHSTTGLETEQRIDALKQIIKTAPSSRSPTIARAEREMQRILTNVRNRTNKADQEKAALTEANKVIRWRRKTKQWSSAQEPNLSPIAQSLANMSPSTSRRSSDKKEQTREGILIDLGSPKLSPHSTDLLNNGPFAEKTDSSATVVRTPHPQTHQRIIKLSPSAQELFENGISFDASLKASSNKGSVNLQPVNGQSPPTLVPPSESRKANSVHQLAPDRAFNVVPESSTGDSKASERHQPPLTDSFLDLRDLRRGDPGGLQQQTSKMTVRSPSAPHGIERDHPGKKSLEMKQTKGSFQSLEPDSMIVPKGSYTSPMMSQESKLRRLSAENQLEECDLAFLLGPQRSESHLLKTQVSQPQAQNELAPMERAEAALRGRYHFPVRKFRARSHDQSFGDIPLARDKIKGELQDLKNKLEQIDLPPMMTVPMKARHNKAEQQGEIRDITNQHNKVKEESVFTPITIITGSAPKMFTSTHSQEQDPATNHLGRSASRRLAYNPLTKLKSMEALEPLQNFQRKTTPNSSPNPEHQSKTLALGTTSTEHLESTEPQTRHIVSSTHQTEDADLTLVPHQPSSISRIFTSMVRRGKEVYEEQVDVGKKVHGNGEARPSDARVRRSAPQKEPMGKFSGWPMRGQGPPLQPDKLRQRCMETNQGILDLTRHIPGSYPIHLDAEEDIVDLFNAFRREANKGYQKPGLFAALKEASRTVKANGIWLLRLYWATVRPVFNVESEYWERNVRHASTWKDCASLVLAAPAGLLLMMSFV